MTVEDILRDICDWYGITEGDLIGKGKTKKLVAARREYWERLARKGLSTVQIADKSNASRKTVYEALYGRKARPSKAKPKGETSKPKRRANNMLRPGAKVWWADHDATVIEDFGPSVKVRAFGDVYTVAKTEVIER